MRFVSTDKAPTPGGHYSQATVHNEVIYVSGQLPITPGEKPGAPGPFEEQIERALTNGLGIVEAAGGSKQTVLRVTIYLAHIDDWAAANEVFALVFGDHKPARAIVPVNLLHYGYGVEVDMIAAVSD